MVFLFSFGVVWYFFLRDVGWAGEACGDVRDGKRRRKRQRESSRPRGRPGEGPGVKLV